MNNLIGLLDKSLVKKGQVRKFYENSYKPNLRLLSYTLSDDKSKIIIHSHGNIGQDTILYLAQKFSVQNIPEKPPKEWTPQELARLIDAINEQFNQHKDKNVIHKLTEGDPLINDDAYSQKPYHQIKEDKESQLIKYAVSETISYYADKDSKIREQIDDETSPSAIDLSSPSMAGRFESEKVQFCHGHDSGSNRLIAFYRRELIKDAKKSTSSLDAECRKNTYTDYFGVTKNCPTIANVFDLDFQNNLGKSERRLLDDLITLEIQPDTANATLQKLEINLEESPNIKDTSKEAIVESQAILEKPQVISFFKALQLSLTKGPNKKSSLVHQIADTTAAISGGTLYSATQAAGFSLLALWMIDTSTGSHHMQEMEDFMSNGLDGKMIETMIAIAVSLAAIAMIAVLVSAKEKQKEVNTTSQSIKPQS